jgi:hypothetical protein
VSSSVVSQPQSRRSPRRVLVKTLWTIGGIILGILIFFSCQDVFAGYPQYGTDILDYVSLTIFIAVACVAWIIDHRRLDAGEFDGDHGAGE